MHYMLLILPLTALVGPVIGFSYHFGTSCPKLETVQNFDINRFLGNWYVIEKTLTPSACMMNNYVHNDGKLQVECSSINFILRMANIDHKFKYVGELSQPGNVEPGRMTVRFPYSVAGDASHDVLMTDYENYACVFSCQRMAVLHRRSATILSRTPTLDKVYLDQIHDKLNSYGLSTSDLSIIRQNKCPPVETGFKIHIDGTSAFGIVANKVGEQIGKKISENAVVQTVGAVSEVFGDEISEYDKILDIGELSEWLP